jgi:hypothetical protein
MSTTTLTAKDIISIHIHGDACKQALRIMSISSDGPLAAHIDRITNISLLRGSGVGGGWSGCASAGGVVIDVPAFTGDDVVMALASLASPRK